MVSKLLGEVSTKVLIIPKHLPLSLVARQLLQCTALQRSRLGVFHGQVDRSAAKRGHSHAGKVSESDQGESCSSASERARKGRSVWL